MKGLGLGSIVESKAGGRRYVLHGVSTGAWTGETIYSTRLDGDRRKAGPDLYLHEVEEKFRVIARVLPPVAADVEERLLIKEAGVVHLNNGLGRPSCGAATSRGDSVAFTDLTCSRCRVIQNSGRGKRSAAEPVQVMGGAHAAGDKPERFDKTAYRKGIAALDLRELREALVREAELRFNSAVPELVWVVTAWTPHDEIIVGVFTTKDLAEKYMETHERPEPAVGWSAQKHTLIKELKA